MPMYIDFNLVQPHELFIYGPFGLVEQLECCGGLLQADLTALDACIAF